MKNRFEFQIILTMLMAVLAWYDAKGQGSASEFLYVYPEDSTAYPISTENFDPDTATRNWQLNSLFVQ
jgi:hypothetical protein